MAGKQQHDAGLGDGRSRGDIFKHNAILSGLTEAQRGDLKTAELVELTLRDPIYAAERSITHAFFPIDSVLSVVTRMKEGGVIEIGTIGREGCSAIPLIMGATRTANDCYCQVPGHAIKISADEFYDLRTSNRDFSSRLDRFFQGYVNFLGQLAGCNRLHSVYERTSRWLLLTHDRVARDDIALTHEYLAMMLGSRRTGVTIALSALRQAGYIQYTRGKMVILDRRGLEETTCECYAVARAQFGAALGTSSA